MLDSPLCIVIYNRSVAAMAIYCFQEGPVSTEVDIDVGGGNAITAVINFGSTREMGLTEGGEAHALFKASSVIVGVK